MNATAPGTPRTDDCLLRPGNTNCGGCGMSIGLTMLDRALTEAGQSCSLVIPACCGIVTAGAFPTTSYGVPTIATTFASSPAVASGVAAIRDLNDEPGQVICWAGDGGTYDIGLGTLSTAFSIKGMRFLLLHSPCPTGWKSEPEDSVLLVRLAVASGLFPLYEVFDGIAYRINVEPDETDPAEYFHRQRRFADDDINLDGIRQFCSNRMQRLRALAKQQSADA